MKWHCTWIVHSLTCARPSQQLYQASPLTQRMLERISMRAGHKLFATNLHMYTKQKYFLLLSMKTTCTWKQAGTWKSKIHILKMLHFVILIITLNPNYYKYYKKNNTKHLSLKNKAASLGLDLDLDLVLYGRVACGPMESGGTSQGDPEIPADGLVLVAWNPNGIGEDSDESQKLQLMAWGCARCISALLCYSSISATPCPAMNISLAFDIMHSVAI